MLICCCHECLHKLKTFLHSWLCHYSPFEWIHKGLAPSRVRNGLVVCFCCSLPHCLIPSSLCELDSYLSFVWHLFQTQNPFRSLWPCVLAMVLTNSATISYLAMCLAQNTCHCTSNSLPYTCCCCTLHWSIHRLPVTLFTWLHCDLGQTWWKFLFQIDWK